MNKVIFLEFAGLVLDTSFVFEDELEDGCRTCLYKFNKYFYKTILVYLEIIVGNTSGKLQGLYWGLWGLMKVGKVSKAEKVTKSRQLFDAGSFFFGKHVLSFQS